MTFGSSNIKSGTEGRRKRYYIKSYLPNKVEACPIKKNNSSIPQKNTYLTKKELEIILAMRNGVRPKQIAYELGSSLHTVNTHLSNIKGKLNCDSSFQLGVAIGEHLNYLAQA